MAPTNSIQRARLTSEPSTCITFSLKPQDNSMREAPLREATWQTRKPRNREVMGLFPGRSAKLAVLELEHRRSGSKVHVPDHSAIFHLKVERNKCREVQLRVGIGSCSTVAASWWERKGNRT